MNYKKSLISLVAAMALSTSALADGNAIYVPMSSDTRDGQWKLIGVNGLSTGVKSPFGQSSAGFTSGYVSVTETNTTDYLESASDDGLVSVLALKSSGMDALQIAMPLSGVTFEPKEPVRSMYVAVGTAYTTPNVKINYKSSLEDARVEFYIDNDMETRYETVINQDNTFANFAIATTSESSTSATKSKIVDVLDFNATDNPLDPKYYNKADDLNTSGLTAMFYHFNALTQQWEIWDKDLTDNPGANDFEDFKIGDAYWGFVDRNDTLAANTSDADAATTLILGAPTTGVTATVNKYSIDSSVDYDKDSNSRLANGWNMISLDYIKPNIRHAATGLLIRTLDVNATINIGDSTGAHRLDIDVLTGTSGAEKATAINLGFAKAKLDGTIPKYFNVKAFGTDQANDIILISDERFTIKDHPHGSTGVDCITTVKTLNDQFPYNNLGGMVVDITNLDHNISDTLGSMESATSAYGEYTLMLNTLVGASSIDNLGTGNKSFSKLEFGDNTNGDHGPIILTKTTSDIADIATNLSAAANTAFTTGTFTPQITPVDTDNDGTEDMVIVANATPFYVKDKTYTRVFTVSADGSGDITIDGSSEKNVTATDVGDGTANAAAIATSIDGVFADTAVHATSTAASLIVASVGKGNFDLKDVADQSIDILKNTSLDNDLAKGAISSVHALDEIAKITLVPHTWRATGFSINADVNDTNDSICIEIISPLDFATDGNGTLCTLVEALDINGSGNDVNISADDSQDTNTTSRLAWFDAIVNDMTVQLQGLVTGIPLSGYAYHTYDPVADNLSSAEVVLVSYDVNDTNITLGVGDMSAPTSGINDDTDSLTLGGSGLIGGALIDDLSTNAVHTPNFASYGPLYTMYDAGYDVRAILKAETDMSIGTITSTSAIVWDSIDLTRDENDWFLNNEMNLFKANTYSGYWVYLEQITPPNITIGTPEYNAVYTYYFDKDQDVANSIPQDRTTNIVNGGSLTVDVTGIVPATSSVFASIDGIEFEMKSSGESSTEYTADLTNYAIAGFVQKTTGPTAVTIRVTNGKGEYEKDDTFSFDFQQPEINATTYPNLTNVQFNTDETNTTFHVFENYIPELATTRESATLTTLIDSVPSTTGTATMNICKELTFGDVSEIVVVTADGDGIIGNANLSNADTFTYATMLKGAQVLSHTQGSTDIKSTHGIIYDANCDVSDSNTTVADDSGVSLKSLNTGKTAYLSYAEIEGIGTDLSVAYTQSWSIDGADDVIQVQNLDEYAGKTFFVEYDGLIYTGTFAVDNAQTLGTLNAITPKNNTLQ